MKILNNSEKEIFYDNKRDGWKKRKISHSKMIFCQRPKGGWKKNTWYLVHAAFGSGNPVSQYVLFTGFLDDNKEPSKYSAIFQQDAVSTSETPSEYHSCSMVSVIAELYVVEEKTEYTIVMPDNFIAKARGEVQKETGVIHCDLNL